jgi:UMF1 family MFS transporter
MMKEWLNIKTLSWALYDFANTIFSMNIVTLYFPLFLIQNIGGSEIHLSFAISVSMAIGAIVSPFFGMFSDMKLRKNIMLSVTTISCVVFTIFIPQSKNIYLILFFFIMANFLYQISLIVYDSLLPSTTTENFYGIVSGFGVALGYLGTFIALIVGKTIVQTPQDNTLIFLPTALLFLIFSIPCFFVKEIKKVELGRIRIKETVKRILSERNLFNYFVGHILYLDAVNTIIAFMAIFLVKIGGFSQEKGEINNFFLFSTMFAVIGGFFWGHFIRKYGAKKGLQLTLLLWTLLLLIVLFPFNKAFFWFLGPLTGIALAGTWSCDRPLLLSLINEGEAGRFFGFYYLTGKISSIIGPLLFGFILSLPIDSEATRYKCSFFSLFLMVTIALYFIKKINDSKKV